MPSPRQSFVRYLVSRGLLDAQAAARAELAMSSTRHAADTVLTELGLIAEQELAAAQADYLGLELIGSGSFPVDRIIVGTVADAFWGKAGLLPLAYGSGTLVVAGWRPLQQDEVRALAYYLGSEVEIRVAARSLFEREHARLYAAEGDQAAGPTGAVAGEDDIERLRDIAREEPIIRLVSRLIAEAAHRSASDIHIEALEDHLRVRYRIDGALQTVERLDKSLQAGVISRIKILARLNIAERRLPQDGRFKLAVRGSEIDFRISTVPSFHGESVVLRLLDRRELSLEFEALGFSSSATAAIRRLISHPNGVVLVTGPTGSGKTTTLYAAMTELNSAERKILTIEDPIEYHLPGINQTQVKPQIGLDFASALRAFLRQDPDVIMVGEIRDAETARTAVQASLTGHLVLSTVHTNSAAATITRLIDMEVEDYLLVSALHGIIAQRLVRRLCGHCAKREPASLPLLRKMGLGEARVRQLGESGLRTPCGCSHCSGRGYRGRTTVSEVLAMSGALQDAVLSGKSSKDIDAIARREGMQSLFESGLDLVAGGETSLDEILKVASPP